MTNVYGRRIEVENRARRKVEHEGTFETSIEEKTTLEVKHEENSEHEGTFENEKDEMEKKEVSIPVFDGEDYSLWKKRITMYLKLKKYDVVITEQKLLQTKMTGKKRT